MDNMEKQHAILLYDLGTKPHEIAQWNDLPINEVDVLIDDYEKALNDIERFYDKYERPKVAEAVKQMKLDVPESERYEIRRRYLLGQLQELKKDTENPKLKKVMLEIKIFTGKLKGITPDKVVSARNYPITELLKSRNGMALCPFHDEKTPSMNIKNNFYYCHGCGATGDVIDFVMKRDGLSFVQAVNKLI